MRLLIGLIVVAALVVLVLYMGTDSFGLFDEPPNACPSGHTDCL